MTIQISQIWEDDRLTHNGGCPRGAGVGIWGEGEEADDIHEQSHKSQSDQINSSASKKGCREPCTAVAKHGNTRNTNGKLVCIGRIQTSLPFVSQLHFALALESRSLES